MNLLASHTFRLVLAGTFLLGLSAGMVGTVTVLHKKSLIGDAIGHSGFPGIVLFFMLFSTRSPYVLLSGAVATGLLAFSVITLVDRNSRRPSDTSLAIVLSAFFGLGMALKSYIQGNPAYANASQSGLANYIFGQAAFMTSADLWLIFSVSLFSITIFLLCAKEIKLFVFDAEFLKVSGFSASVTGGLVMMMTIALIAAGLKVVGSILISSMLIAPTVCAMQWSNRYGVVVTVSALVGGCCAALGTVWSSLGRGISTGPAIVLLMSVCALCSLIFGRYGIVRRMWKARRYARCEKSSMS